MKKWAIDPSSEFRPEGEANNSPGCNPGKSKGKSERQKQTRGVAAWDIAGET